MAVRLALGAGRGRLVRQLLTESLCLAMGGGLVGLALAHLLRAGLLSLASDTAIALPAALDLRTLAFVFLLTLAAGLMLGLLPALRITRTEAATGLREEGRGIAGSAAWLRVGKLVVVGQLALSLPLLVGAGLLVRTLFNLQRVDLGYPRDGVVTVRVDAQAAGYDPARQTAAFEAAAGAHPRGARRPRRDLLEQRALRRLGQRRSDHRRRLHADGPRRHGIALRRRRPRLLLDARDPRAAGPRDHRAGSRPIGRTVCVINETFAKRFFNGRNPIGLHVTQRYADERHTYEVVGVVRDSRQNRLRGEIEHRFYTPATQPAASISAVTFIIRPRGDAAAVLSDVRRVVQQAEPDMPISRAGTLAEAVDARIVQDRLLAQLSIAFGVVALLLAAIGLYGVLSYGVVRRTNEIGIRKALGARDGTLIGMILRETGWLLLVGLVAGTAVSAGAIRLLTSRLYGLSPTDPGTFAIAVAGLACVAALATWLPAYRASRVDPLVALRHE